MNYLNDVLSDRVNDLFPNNIIQTNSAFQQQNDNQVNSQDAPNDNNLNNSENSINSDGLDKTKLKSMIYSMKDQLESMLRLLEGKEIKSSDNNQISGEEQALETGERIIEGVFNGEKMIGSDGREHSVPPNYASKSKLVEGDMMKLTITNNGSFIFKQIGPIERKRIVGELVTNSDTDQWGVSADNKRYKVLTASVTFYKGKLGDEVVLLVPQDSESEWGAVENIISK